MDTKSEVIVNGASVQLSGKQYRELAKQYVNCTDFAVIRCGSEYRGYTCTSHKGHVNDHVAHGGEGQICAVWSDALVRRYEQPFQENIDHANWEIERLRAELDAVHQIANDEIKHLQAELEQVQQQHETTLFALNDYISRHTGIEEDLVASNKRLRAQNLELNRKYAGLLGLFNDKPLHSILIDGELKEVDEVEYLFYKTWCSPRETFVDRCLALQNGFLCDRELGHEGSHCAHSSKGEPRAVWAKE